MHGGLFAPGCRGRKRKHIIEESTHQDSEGEDSGPSTSHEEGIELASLQSIPHLHELGGVKGRYLPHAVHNPSEHAIAVTLGRILVWGTVNAAPRRTLEGLMTQMCLANVALGEKYHGHWFTSLFAGIAARLCQRLTHCRFNDMPPNLPFPSAFRFIWDGITLRNGATVVPVLCVFTDHSGRIVSELLDVPISQGSSGDATAALVHDVLQRVLHISVLVPYKHTCGLPLHSMKASSTECSHSLP